MIKRETIDLDALRAREPVAFRRLVERYSQRIYNLGLKMLKDPARAEDVLQETFVSAYQAIDGFEGRSHISTWLYRIAYNEVLMLLRREKRGPALDSLEEDLDVESTPHLGTSLDSPERRLMQAELSEVMDEALAELSDRLRVTFILRDIEGLSTAETAAVLDLSETAVKSRLHRARLALRQRLAPYLRDLSLERV